MQPRQSRRRGGSEPATGSAAVYYTRGDQSQLLSQRNAVDGGTASPPLRAAGRARQHSRAHGRNGDVSRRYAYDPYGRNHSTSGPDPDTRIAFAGAGVDDQNLYHDGARYYDPHLARWNQRDALNQPADLRQASRYTYVGRDPVNLTDPSGLNHNDDGRGQPPGRADREFAVFCVGRGAWVLLRRVASYTVVGVTADVVCLAGGAIAAAVLGAMLIAAPYGLLTLVARRASTGAWLIVTVLLVALTTLGGCRPSVGRPSGSRIRLHNSDTGRLDSSHGMAASMDP